MIPAGPQHFNNTPQFDSDAANQERLDWRLGDTAPTERALGVQESFRRQYEADMAAKKAEDEAVAVARRQKIDSRLSGAALNSIDLGDI